MKVILCLLLLAGWTQPEPADALLAQLFKRGVTFDQFLAKAGTQRERWLKNASAAASPTDLVDRLKRSSEGLQFLIVAEDWCPDSVNTVPWIARLAASVGDDVRIVDRSSGEPLMAQHRTPDGRTATPTVVLIRHGRDVGAWVERPAVLQRLFLSIATSPAAAKEFADRQAWYDADRGRTTLEEIVALAEHAGAQADKAWRMSVDGRLFATFNRQGGRRGGIDFRSQNWFMAMAHRPLAKGDLTLNGMMSLEPLTVGSAGYLELFQEGETYRGLQITDRQHPHDLLAQLAAVWRIPLGDRSSFTIAGGPIGEPALGPVSFMHRASAAENPIAPLSHHIFDSTHLASTVILGRLDDGPLSVEGSIFRGREPDSDRYDIDVGKPDSWSARVWLRPGTNWTMQASHGYLHEPEPLEPGDQRRTNASVSWFRQHGTDYSAVTAAVGQNARRYSVVRALLLEATTRFGASSLYSRFEQTMVETEILLLPEIVHRPHAGELVDSIHALTAGAVRDVARVKKVALGFGADVSVYGVPDLLQITHGAQPVSFHVFVRIGRAALEGRMWNTTMASPTGMGGMGGMAHHH